MRKLKKRSTKSKVYELIGRAVTAIAVYAIAEAGAFATSVYILNNCITTIM